MLPSDRVRKTASEIIWDHPKSSIFHRKSIGFRRSGIHSEVLKRVGSAERRERCQNHPRIVPKSFQNLLNIIPKSSPNNPQSTKAFQKSSQHPPINASGYSKDAFLYSIDVPFYYKDASLYSKDASSSSAASSFSSSLYSKEFFLYSKDAYLYSKDESSLYSKDASYFYSKDVFLYSKNAYSCSKYASLYSKDAS